MDKIIRLSDPRSENSRYEVELEFAIKKVFSSGQYILGNEVETFEKNFASYCNSKYCISTASGSDSLVLGLRALGCGANDQIATIPNAGYYATAAILAIGATPVYIDICEESMTMSADSLEKTLSTVKDIKCVIVTHLYGAMVDMDILASLTKYYGAYLLEDCSQSHGAVFNGKCSGTIGDLGVYSFYPTKNLGALGDAGAIITSNKKVFENVTKLRQYGWSEKYRVELYGGQNSRMDEIQAAFLNVKLSKLNELNAARKLIVQKYYLVSLDNIKVFYSDGDNYVAHLAIIRVSSFYRDKLFEFLVENNISCDIHFPILDYKQPANFISDVFCEVAERIVDEILTIPCHPTMSETEVSYIIDKLKEFDKSL